MARPLQAGLTNKHRHIGFRDVDSNITPHRFTDEKVLKQKGALKKYFDGSFAENHQQMSKEWVRDPCSSF